MSQLFSRSANSVVRAVLVLAIVVAAGAPVALLAWARTPPATGQFRAAEQPVAFSHPLHVNGFGIDCRYCHAGAMRTASAGLPPTEACVHCHSTGYLQSSAFQPVLISLQTRRSIPWQRVTSLPDYVYFDHSIHTNKGIGCESCHGRVDLMMPVHQAAPLTMSWCLDCHRAPERNIRPLAAVTTMGWKPPADQETRGRALMQEYHVRKIITCSACHR